MVELTPTQRRILDFIQAEMNAGRPIPTHREICERFGYQSPRAAACHLAALQRKGFLKLEPRKSRAMRVTTPLAKLRPRLVDIPLLGSVPAGYPESAEQEAEGCVSVDMQSIGIKQTRGLFALRVTGNSMIGRHILDGDIVVIEENREPRDGQIVAALIDGERTLKTFVKKGGKTYLRAENPKYPDLVPAEELVIRGVFKALIRHSME